MGMRNGNQRMNERLYTMSTIIIREISIFKNIKITKFKSEIEIEMEIEWISTEFDYAARTPFCWLPLHSCGFSKSLKHLSNCAKAIHVPYKHCFGSVVSRRSPARRHPPPARVIVTTPVRTTANLRQLLKNFKLSYWYHDMLISCHVYLIVDFVSYAASFRPLRTPHWCLSP